MRIGIGLVSMCFSFLFMAGCGEPFTAEDAINRLDAPDKSMHIYVKSIPTGAHVYGNTGRGLGTYLGDTPLLLKYTQGGGKIWCSHGTTVEETLLIKDDFGQPWESAKLSYTFRCIVTKEGYRPYKIYEVLYDKSGWLDTPYFGFAGVKRIFTAMLEPSSKSEERTASPIPQQQQQQQQQTVVIPGGQSETPQMGTVMVSSNVQGADVYVDGMFVGNTPANLKLKDGIHIIEVKKQGCSSYRKELRVFGGSELSLRAELSK